MRSKTPRINRFSQIIRFIRVSRLLLWTIWVIYRERQRVVRARERGNYEVHPNVEVLIEVLVAFRTTAIKLGVLMIKLGQFLSSRADLLPEQALAILSTLQDEVPPASYEHVTSVIESELGKPIEVLFTSFDRKCAAAASLGQVHKAVLASTGETVAVKVQRPNIDQLVDSDLSTLKFVIWVLNRFVNTRDFIDLMGVYREFKRTVYEEIDFVKEAANAKRFKEMFQDDPNIYVPAIYDAYTSRRVLVLEWIDGIKINDYATLDALHVNRMEVAKRTVDAYFHQFFDEGFFHADPHPGNILVKRGSPSSSPVVVFLDFGMVGSLTKSMKKSLKDLFLGFVSRDSKGLVNAMAKLGFIGEGANMASIERGMGLMMEQYFGLTLGEVRELEIPDVAHDIENLLYGQPFQIPAQFAFTGRAIGTLVGVSTGLAPDFNFIDVATPYARKFLGLDAAGAGQTIQDILSQVVQSGRILLALPKSLEQMLSKIETGQLEVKIAGLSSSNGRRRGPARRRNGNGNGNGNGSSNGDSALLTQATDSLSLPIIFVASLAGGVYLLSSPAKQERPAWFCLALSGVTGLAMVLKR